MNLTGFFEQSMLSLRINQHGVFNKEEVIQLTKSVQPPPSTIEIMVDNQPYMLSIEEYREAVKKLRNHLTFPSITEFPVVKYNRPEFNFRNLMTIQADRLNPSIEINKTYLTGSEDVFFNAESRSIVFYGHIHPVNGTLLAYLESGRKIALRVNQQYSLEWVNSYELEALEGYDASVNQYENKIKRIAEYFEESKTYTTKNIYEGGIFENLPMHVVGAEKCNLSGLSERSWGDGRKRNTVIHLKVLEHPLSEYSSKDSLYGGSVLCSKQTGRHMGLTEASWFKHNPSSIEHSDISCKSCLSKLKTLLKKHAQTTTV